MDKKLRSQQIAALEKQIEDLKAQWPAHSVKPWMLQQLEDLEDQLLQLQKDDPANDDLDNPNQQSQPVL
jgi:hypothetical protein